MALTDTALKALKPRDETYTVTDDRGLYVDIFPTGGVVWRYRYRLNGKYEKLTLGKYPALTLKNARLKRDEAAHLMALGQSPVQKKRQEKVAGVEDATVADFAERFFKDIQSRDRKNVTMPHRYLGSNTHGLRHGYAQARYLVLTGWKAPAAGGPPTQQLTPAQQGQDHVARQTISRELGHERLQITAVYLGR